MSILTQLVERKITFSQAATEAEGWVEKVVGHDPTAKATAAAVLSDVKQGASNAVDMADKALGAAIGPATLAVETAAETTLASVTKGASIPFNPLISDEIERIAGALKAAADAWSLKAKAALVPTSTAAASAVETEAAAS